MSASKIDKNDVEIMAVPTEVIFPNLKWTGFATGSEKALLETIECNNFHWRRGDLENDPTNKQIIPQLLWVVDGKVFVHKIPETGGEARLHKQMPIFLGGHIDRDDGNLERASWREFYEETGIGPLDGEQVQAYTKQFVGVVNDETNEVSQVHLGIVYIVRGPDTRHLYKYKKDDGVSDGFFLTPEQVDEILPALTYWSRLAWPHIRHLV